MTEVIGICGRSCSGKSFVSKELLKYFDANRINADMYFKKKPKRAYGDFKNFDTIDSLRFDLLVSALKNLTKGKPAKIVSEVKTEIPDKIIEPREILILEGFLIFAVPEVLKFIDKKIYLEISDENLIKRRTARARSKYDTDMNYIKRVVLPNSKKYAKIQKKEADIVIDANQPKEKVLKDVLDFLKAFQ